MAEALADTNALVLATGLTVAWLSNPNTQASTDEVPAFLGRMHQALGALSAAKGEEVAQVQEAVVPAVSVRKSLASPEHIISMLDGKAYKTLRRHLSRHGLTPEQYRERFGLKRNYPMVSEAYSEERRAMAKKIGLGRNARSGGNAGPENVVADAVAPAAEAKPKQTDVRD